MRQLIDYTKGFRTTEVEYYTKETGTSVLNIDVGIYGILNYRYLVVLEVEQKQVDAEMQ